MSPRGQTGRVNLFCSAPAYMAGQYTHFISIGSSTVATRSALEPSIAIAARPGSVRIASTAEAPRLRFRPRLSQRKPEYIHTFPPTIFGDGSPQSPPCTISYGSADAPVRARTMVTEHHRPVTVIEVQGLPFISGPSGIRCVSLDEGCGWSRPRWGHRRLLVPPFSSFLGDFYSPAMREKRPNLESFMY
jgi:hypothetical protein